PHARADLAQRKDIAGPSCGGAMIGARRSHKSSYPEDRRHSARSDEARGALGRADALLDDPVFFMPFVAFFDPRIGRPATPMETHMRVMFLKFRYRLGYESLCREVADSISWQRFCRISLGSRVRRRFAVEPAPADVVATLVAAAAAEVAQLIGITKPEHRLATARLSQEAYRRRTPTRPTAPSCVPGLRRPVAPRRCPSYSRPARGSKTARCSTASIRPA